MVNWSNCQPPYGIENKKVTLDYPYNATKYHWVQISYHYLSRLKILQPISWKPSMQEMKNNWMKNLLTGGLKLLLKEVMGQANLNSKDGSWWTFLIFPMLKILEMHQVVLLLFPCLLLVIYINISTFYHTSLSVPFKVYRCY